MLIHKDQTMTWVKYIAIAIGIYIAVWISAQIYSGMLVQNESGMLPVAGTTQYAPDLFIPRPPLRVKTCTTTKKVVHGKVTKQKLCVSPKNKKSPSKHTKKSIKRSK